MGPITPTLFDVSQPYSSHSWEIYISILYRTWTHRNRVLLINSALCPVWFIVRYKPHISTWMHIIWIIWMLGENNKYLQIFGCLFPPHPPPKILGYIKQFFPAGETWYLFSFCICLVAQIIQVSIIQPMIRLFIFTAKKG